MRSGKARVAVLTVTAVLTTAMVAAVTFSRMPKGYGQAPGHGVTAAKGKPADGKARMSARPAEVEKMELPRVEGARAGAATARLAGDWPAKMPKVSINQRKGTVAEALRAVAKQAGWDLMLSAPEALSERPITLQVKNRPAAEVLDLVLMHGQLKAALKNRVLVVTPSAGPAGTEKTDRWKAFDEGKPADAQARRARAKGTATAGRPGAPAAMGEEPDLKDRSAEPLDDRGDVRSPRRKGRHRRTKNDRVVVGQSLRIPKNEEVDSAVAIGGSVTVFGTVHHEAVAIGGSVVVEPGATVKGDAVAIGGKVEVKEGGRVEGDRVAIGGSLKGVVAFFSGLATGSVAWFMHSMVGTFVRALVLLLFALMVITFMPERLERIRQYMADRPGASILGGVGLAIGFIPMCVLLAITIIGIIMIPFAVLGLLAVHVIGLTAFMVWLGYKIPLFGSKKSPIVAMIMGLAVITLIDLIPVVGTLTVAAIAFISAGAVLLSSLGKPPQAKAETGTTAEAPAAG